MTNATTRKRQRTRAHEKGRQATPEAITQIRALIGEQPLRRGRLIEYLHAIQDRYQHISAAHIVALAHEMKLAPVEIYEVATFYQHFDVVRENETPPPALTVRVCDSISCAMCGTHTLADKLRQAHPEIRVQHVPCVGRCDAAPVAVVGQNPIPHATPESVTSAIQLNQTSCPATDAIVLNEYVAGGGYALLQRLHTGTINREDILSTLEQANLRGLGGAGFNTGKKWRIVSQQPAPRYLCVNIDEGEPGTFKDRALLERDPHRMLEGALIAAHVVGCDAIYIYLRDEYAGVRATLRAELDKLRANPPCALPLIELRRGAGAYVCGEESAMIESIEGKRGLPRLRPPYVAEVGLFGRPTLVNNCETLFWVREIVERGAAWFASFGRNGRRGLRRYSVSGRVQKPGVHLAPAGITLNELIAEYCGGMLDGHMLKAYFPGGASGGILPASLADVPLDFDTLQPHGSFIGSAAVIVLSQHDSVREVALNAMRFFRHESCGQCTPCRLGTAKAAELMLADQWNETLLNDLSQAMIDASICGLGQAAPNPMRSVLRYFKEEAR